MSNKMAEQRVCGCNPGYCMNAGMLRGVMAKDVYCAKEQSYYEIARAGALDKVPSPVASPVGRHSHNGATFFPYSVWASWYGNKLFLMRRLGFLYK